MDLSFVNVYDTDLHLLNHPCELGNESHLVIVCDLFICCWIQLIKVLLSIFKSVFIKDIGLGVPIVAQCLMNPTSIHEDEGSIPGLTQWV